MHHLARTPRSRHWGVPCATPTRRRRSLSSARAANAPRISPSHWAAKLAIPTAEFDFLPRGPTSHSDLAPSAPVAARSLIGISELANPRPDCRVPERQRLQSDAMATGPGRHRKQLGCTHLPHPRLQRHRLALVGTGATAQRDSSANWFLVSSQEVLWARRARFPR